MGQPLPEMSVVLLTPGTYETIRRTIGCLRAQTVRDRLEIVIVAPKASALGLDQAELAGFFRVRVVEADPIRSGAAARAAGICQATAPVVALGEDHSFPDPDWAEALIAAHRQPWAVVGPVVDNANPGTAISWANHLVEYGPWIAPAVPGPVEFLPGHNSAYKRDLLLDYGPELGAMLEAECLLHQDLRRRGYQVYLEPRARTRHLNYSKPFSWIPAHFHGSRLFAAARTRYGRWSLRQAPGVWGRLGLDPPGAPAAHSGPGQEDPGRRAVPAFAASDRRRPPGERGGGDGGLRRRPRPGHAGTVPPGVPAPPSSIPERSGGPA